MSELSTPFSARENGTAEGSGRFSRGVKLVSTLTAAMALLISPVTKAQSDDEESILVKRAPGTCTAAVVELPEILADKLPKKPKKKDKKGSELADEKDEDDKEDKTPLLPPTPNQEIVIEGDEFETLDGNSVLMKGDAQITQGTRGLFADQIQYDQDSYLAHAQGNVSFYSMGGDLIKTNSMRMEADTFIGEAGDSEMYVALREEPDSLRKKNYIDDNSFFAPLTNRIRATDDEDDEADADRGKIKSLARIKAERVDIEGAEFQRLTNATLTRCPEGSQDVEITGNEVELDHGTGIAHAKGMKLKFKGVPIFYAPRMSFPIGDTRKSGFLFPALGNNDVNGFTVSIPYYFNLAPNYDATLIPTWYAERGLQLLGEFRYLGAHSDGEIKAEYMSDDELFDGEARHALGIEYKLRHPNGWGARIDLQDVSDTEYLDDFENEVNITGTTYLPQYGEVYYRNKLWDVTGRLRQYELVDEALRDTKPYDYLPQISLNIHPEKVGMFEYGLESEYTQFEHDDTSRITGSRLNAKPWVELPIEPVWGYLKPKIALRSISYNLSNIEEGAESSPSVAVPALTVDSGVFFERDIKWGDKDYLQTLEPRVMYVNVPAENQDDLPDFDTSEGTSSSYSYLFREDRFFGGDRVGDDHHIAIGVSSAIIDDDDGKEKLKASIGQLYYLDDREIGLKADAEPQTESESDIFAELTSNLTDSFSANAGLRWDQEDGEIDAWNLNATYDDDLRRKLAINYTFNRNTSGGKDNKDVYLDFDWPISDRFQVGIEQRYNLTKSEAGASVYQLTYDACCWAVGLAAQHTLHRDGKYRDSLMLTFELAGIGRIQTDDQ